MTSTQEIGLSHRALDKPRWQTIPVALIAAVVLASLVGPAWRSWFSVDDSAVLLCAQYGIIELLFDQATSNFCNPLFFTPVWPLLFKVDGGLIGLVPEGYRLANLAIAVAASALFFVILRQYVGFRAALVGALLLAVALPMVYGVGWITRRHYLMGFLLALVAIRALQVYGEGHRNRWLLLGVLAYFLAVLSKEAYAFIPAVVPLIAWREPLVRRFLLILPFAAALGVYFLWRSAMLGGLGGYPTVSLNLEDLLAHGWEQLMLVPSGLFGPLAWAFLVPLVILLFANVRAAVVLLLIGLASLTPLMLFPGSGFEHVNKLFGVIAVVGAFFAFSLQASLGRPWLTAVVLVAAAALAAGSVERSLDASARVHASGQEFAARYDAAYAPGAQSVLVIGSLPYYFTSMNALHRMSGTGEHRHLVAISDEIALPDFIDIRFDRVVLPDGTSLDGQAARVFLEERLIALENSRRLARPTVVASRRERSLEFISSVEPGEQIIRCLVRADFANCAPVGPRYVFPYPAREPILWLDFYRQSDGLVSPPLRVIPESL